MKREEFIELCNNVISATQYATKDIKEYIKNEENNSLDKARFLISLSAHIYAKAFLKHIESISFEQENEHFLEELVFTWVSTSIKKLDIQLLYFIALALHGKSVELIGESVTLFQNYNMHPEPIEYWDARDASGSAINYLNPNKYYNFSTSEIYSFIYNKIEVLKNVNITTGNYNRLVDFKRKPDYTGTDDLVFYKRKTLWVECDYPKQFISDFSETYPKINVHSITGKELCEKGLPIKCEKNIKGIAKEMQKVRPDVYNALLHQTEAGILFLYDLPEDEQYSDELPGNVLSLIIDGKVKDDIFPARGLIVVVTPKQKIDRMHWIMSEIYNEITYSFLNPNNCIESPVILAHVIDYMKAVE